MNGKFDLDNPTEEQIKELEEAVANGEDIVDVEKAVSLIDMSEDDIADTEALAKAMYDEAYAEIMKDRNS